jgi:hypothetical protein
MTFKSFFSKPAKFEAAKGETGVWKTVGRQQHQIQQSHCTLFGPEQEKMHRSVIVVLMAVTAQGFSPRIAPSTGADAVHLLVRR